jgi:hemoglobin-like flavoprotein
MQKKSLNDVQVFQQSFARVMRKRGFIDGFYNNLVSKSNEISVLLQHRDIEQQKHKLKGTLEIMQALAQGQPGTRLFVNMVGRIHKRLGIEQKHLDLWESSLLETVEQYDEAFDHQVLTAWLTMTKKLIGYMQSDQNHLRKVAN